MAMKQAAVLRNLLPILRQSNFYRMLCEISVKLPKSLQGRVRQNLIMSHALLIVSTARRSSDSSQLLPHPYTY
jgi:hypothetical protein